MGLQISAPEETAFAQYLIQHAREYYPSLNDQEIDVQLSNRWIRNNSQLYRFEISSNGENHFVYIKVPSLRGTGSRSTRRPYLIPETNSDIKYNLHYITLEAIHQHFNALKDSRFGTVRVLDMLPDYDAFVMEEASGQIMRHLLNRACRFSFHPDPEQLISAINNAGVWLRIFHQDVPPPDCVEKIHETCGDYVNSINRFTEFLAGVLDDQKFFDELASDTADIASKVLPDSLPLGLRFGDYGLTNILVEPDGRVTGIDTMARWQAPIYEDIAWFLSALKAYNMQSYSQGLAFSSRKVNKLEQAFLKGYFGTETIPIAEIRLFEVLRLLERWSAKLSRKKNRSGPVGKTRSFLLNRFFRKTISDLLEAGHQFALSDPKIKEN